MLEGRVVRSYSNVYYVDVGGEVLECRPRGRLRYQSERVLTGDRVRVSRAGPGLGAIDSVLPRKNMLERPPVANVDRVVVVFSFHEPELDLALLDRFLVLVSAAGLEAALCLNKLDLALADEAATLRELYAGLGYPLVATSARSGEGLQALRLVLAGRINVLAGPSGVGKSSLLNALNPELRLDTGRLGRKTGRGTHTTRHVSLVPVGDGGLVADTPGFTRLDLGRIKPTELAWHFPELAALTPECRFRGCLHRAEPDCRVKAALAAGEIDAGRYRRYLELLTEVEAAYRPY